MIASIEQSKDFAEALSYWATAGGIFVALLAGGYAIWRHYSDKRAAGWHQVREIYIEYLTLCLDRPQYLGGFWKDSTHRTEAERRQYIHILGVLLWYAEEVLLLSPRQDWRDSLRTDLRHHVDFFSSVEYRSEAVAWTAELRTLIESVAAEPDCVRGQANA